MIRPALHTTPIEATISGEATFRPFGAFLRMSFHCARAGLDRTEGQDGGVLNLKQVLS